MVQQQLAVAIFLIIRCVYGTAMHPCVERLELFKVQTKKRSTASSQLSGPLLDQLHSVLFKELVSCARHRDKAAPAPIRNLTVGPSNYILWDESIYMLLKHRLFPLRVVMEQSGSKLSHRRMNYGHCNVQATYLEILAVHRDTGQPGAASSRSGAIDSETLRELATLRTWVSNQRSRQRQGTLDPRRRVRLDAVGFLWDKQVNRPAAHRFGLLHSAKPSLRVCLSSSPSYTSWPASPL
jgi:hypothetical protein